MADRYAAVVVDAEVADPDRGSALDVGVLALLRRLHAAGLATAVVADGGRARDVAPDGVVDVLVAGSGPGGRRRRDRTPLLDATSHLGADPGSCVAVVSTASAVEAAREDGFGLVVGLERPGRAGLRRAGADVVVPELTDLANELFFGEEDPWILAYRGFDPAGEGTREALLTLGNGFQAARGAMAHAVADEVHYPGTYVAGTYDRLTTRIGGCEREDESIVNLPNWLPIAFRAAEEGCWFAPGRWSLTGHRVALELRHGVLTRRATATDGAGRRTRLCERRLVSMADPHLAAMEVRLVPENWSGRLEVRSAVDADVHNRNVRANRSLAGRHLEVVDRAHRGDVACIVVETVSSRIRVAIAARTTPRAGRMVTPPCPVGSETSVGHDLCFEVGPGDEVVVEKTVGVATGRDCAIADPASASLDTATAAGPFEASLESHAKRWAELWEIFRFDLDAFGRDQAQAVRLQLAHLVQTLSPHSIDVDAGVPARGLHGEGYCGRVFWDELFVFPLFELRLPELTGALLTYRWRRLGQARRLAAASGGVGARFPWQSGSDGREETPRQFFNPRSGRWVPDHSRRQCHINLAVAFNAWRHWQVTADLGYLARRGAELLVESARFLASIATFDPDADRYDLRGVMGPDEFHDGYPDRPGEGIDNNAYVNIMAAWALSRAREAHDLLGAHLGRELRHRLDLGIPELDRWEHVSRRLRVPFLPSGMLAQFDGYGDLPELDWQGYRERYGNIGRLDLILEAEGDSTNHYQVSKQADVLMLFYLLTAEELTALLARLGYDFDPTTIPATIDHYTARTSHGSTLSRVVHAWVLARTDRARSWQLFRETLRADLADTQGGTTREGIHLGAMAGSVDIVQRCYPGLDARRDVLWFNPLLPDELGRLEFLLRYRDQLVTVRADHTELTLAAAEGPAPPIRVAHVDDQRDLPAGVTLSFDLDAARRSDRRPSLEPGSGG